jgi:class 3 adenylate cyclase
MPDSDWLVVAPGTPAELVVPIGGRLFVGRECAGVDPDRRLLIDHPAVSRDHLELRSHPAGGTTMIDESTNGTRLNGRRVERGEPVPLADGDRLELGEAVLVFHAAARDPVPPSVRTTMRAVAVGRIAVTVGDIVGYTGMTERYGPEPVARATEALFAGLSDTLVEHRGMVGNIAGDSLFAAWDADRDAQAAVRAVSFALHADELVIRTAEDLATAGVFEEPLRMGWAVSLGQAAVGRPKIAREEMHGDAINLAFRLSGVAARGGRAAVLVTDEAAAAAPSAATYDAVEELPIRGRAALARVRPARRLRDRSPA